jgi:hypothetical protein
MKILRSVALIFSLAVASLFSVQSFAKDLMVQTVLRPSDLDYCASAAKLDRELAQVRQARTMFASGASAGLVREAHGFRQYSAAEKLGTVIDIG